jgi:putative transposase
MTRLRRIADRDQIFFITTNLLRNRAAFAPGERDILVEIVGGLRETGAFWLFGYVVMPTHLHLLLKPHGLGLSGLMDELKGLTGKRILRERQIRGPLWQPRYFDNIIRRVRDFWQKLEYIHNNPVAAGLVASPQAWPWSSHVAYSKCCLPTIRVDPIDLPADGDTILWRG